MRRLVLLFSLVFLAGCMGEDPPAQPSDATPAGREALAAPAQTDAPPLHPPIDACGEGTLCAVIASRYLSLREAPEDASDRVKKIETGAVVVLHAIQGDFARVSELATGASGFVMKRYLHALPLNASDQEIPLYGSPGRYRVTAKEYLSLREQPDTSSEAVATLDAGSAVEILSFEGEFARALAGGQEGYVLARYLYPYFDELASFGRIPPYAADGDVYVVDSDASVPMYARPDPGAQRAEKLLRGDRVALVGHDGAYALVEVEATGDRGYVLAEHLTESKLYAGPPAQEAPLLYVDATHFLTLREAPDTAAEAIATLPRAEAVSLIGHEGNFALVRALSTGQEGYVLDSYLSEMPAPPLGRGYARTVAAGEYLTLRDSPDAEAQKLAKIPAGESVDVLDYDGIYAYVRWEGQEGYVHSGYLASGEGNPFAVVMPTDSYAPERAAGDIALLEELYPAWLEAEVIGTSAQGRELTVARLGSPDARRHIFLQAGIHGREHMTSLLVVAQIDALLTGIARGEADAALLNDVCFHILPAANPDGIAISQRAEATPALVSVYESDLAAALTDLPLSDYLRAWKSNAAGVDINRNFSAGWQGLAGPHAPSSDRYKGALPGDQPETQALIRYTKRYPFDATVSYHAYGSFLYWDYGVDARVIAQSRSLAKAVRATARYPLMSSGGIDAGGYKDWAIDVLSIPSITIEIGTRPCPLPIEELTSIWDRNRDMLQALGSWALSQG